jgi:hypothetical protein
MSYKTTDEEFIEAVNSSKNTHEALKKLGLAARGAAYNIFKTRCKKLNLSLDHFSVDKITRKQISNDKIIELCSNLKSRQSVLKGLGLRADFGSNARWIDKKIQDLNINTSHWTGSAWSRGKTFPERIISVNTYIGNSNKRITSYKLKAKLITEGFLQNQCAICNISSWQDKPLSLHLDHINGDHHDNNLENLRLLCPNCHSQTDTYCRKKSSL